MGCANEPTVTMVVSYTWDEEEDEHVEKGVGPGGNGCIHGVGMKWVDYFCHSKSSRDANLVVLFVAGYIVVVDGIGGIRD